MNPFQHPIFKIESLIGKQTLDIGCGRNKLPGSIGVDYLLLPGVDCVADLNVSLPFKNEQLDAVYSSSVLEHISNLPKLIEEIHRILKPGGLMIAHVPYFRSSWAAIDPTHVHQFTLNSMNYFVDGTYENHGYRFSDICFSSIEYFIDYNRSPGIFRFIFSYLARRWPHKYENSFLSFLYPFQSICYVLKK